VVTTLKEKTMQLPVIRGLIERRILVNFRVDPHALKQLLPAPFEPQLVNGYAIAGICLIRLKVGPRFLPAACGLRSENAAHRIAVWWEEHGQRREGVYIPRRDTSSRLNASIGGRLFPGVHHRARFHVSESPDLYEVSMQSTDGGASVLVRGRPAQEFSAGSVFGSLDEISAFFEKGSLGYSPCCDGAQFEGLELRTFNWKVEPLAVERVESSLFDDRTRFPKGSVAFDSALLMHNVRHEWHGRDILGKKSSQEVEKTRV
jgi:hypothetical protein